MREVAHAHSALARTRETRLAYVCGYRNALSDVLTWAAAQSTDRIATGK